MDEGKTDQLVFFAFDLLFLNGESTAQLPLVQREPLHGSPVREIGRRIETVRSRDSPDAEHGGPVRR